MKKGVVKIYEVCVLFLELLGEKNETFKRNERCLDCIRYFVIYYDRSFNFYTGLLLIFFINYQ
ncbi:hypothetical protein KB13_708 [beta proteobacterium KB13]|uniref:Uncharacterized protein n=1 Tax=beta proteobacterium KB13 TaxID=314607 RepID=B6BTJ3_9PROT|nr:hypothetical protein KB13_708 [beta proteobacterium KB13]